MQLYRLWPVDTPVGKKLRRRLLNQLVLKPYRHLQVAKKVKGEKRLPKRKRHLPARPPHLLPLRKQDCGQVLQLAHDHQQQVVHKRQHQVPQPCARKHLMPKLQQFAFLYKRVNRLLKHKQLYYALQRQPV